MCNHTVKVDGIAIYTGPGRKAKLIFADQVDASKRNGGTALITRLHKGTTEDAYWPPSISCPTSHLPTIETPPPPPQKE
jgi:hypothetical protein